MDRTLVRMDHERVDKEIFESTGRKKSIEKPRLRRLEDDEEIYGRWLTDGDRRQWTERIGVCN